MDANNSTQAIQLYVSDLKGVRIMVVTRIMVKQCLTHTGLLKSWVTPPI